MRKKQLAIQVRGVKKRYRLGSIGGRTLQADLQSWWAKQRGKEDPNRKIGAAPTQKENQVFWALKGIDLTIYKGERIGIIGSNGAGKSTLLKLLSRITAPTEGEIRLWGRVSSMLEVGTGFHREMTGRENIYMNGTILGMSRKEINAKIEQIIDFSEVRQFIDTPVKRYSSGMFVKLAFSVAAHLNSEIMIMDEVLAVGDVAFQQKCLQKMQETAEQEGKTILYVSHNMNTIRQLCDRCIVLDHGKIIFDGAVDPAIETYMNHSITDNAVDMDLMGKSHVAPANALQMQRLVLLQKTLPLYTNREILSIRLTVLTKEPLSNILFRLTLRTDTDVGLGTAWSEQFHLPSAGIHHIVFHFPLYGLARGTFYASIGCYQEDPVSARRVTLDHITRAFRFEMDGSSDWNQAAHGYFQFPPIQTEILES